MATAGMKRPRRTDVEESLLARQVPEASTQVGKADLSLVVFEELNRLREKYRLPLVLCYLKGLTTAEAAEQLGCPQGTIHSRLSASARDQLRKRLTRAEALPCRPRRAWHPFLHERRCRGRAGAPGNRGNSNCHGHTIRQGARWRRRAPRRCSGGRSIEIHVHEKTVSWRGGVRRAVRHLRGRGSIDPGGLCRQTGHDAR